MTSPKNPVNTEKKEDDDDEDHNNQDPLLEGEGGTTTTAGIQLERKRDEESGQNVRKNCGRSKFINYASSCSAAPFIILIQSSLILLFFLFVSYDEEADATFSGEKLDTSTAQSLPGYYPMFQDVHVMIFVGFGFLMTFLRKYGVKFYRVKDNSKYSAVGYNFLLAAIAIQWSILCRGLFHHEGTNIPINISSLIQGDFAAGAVLISFGAILGIQSPVQLLFLVLIEVALYTVNEFVGAELFQAIDVGGSMYIHTFGAYFGLAASFMIRRNSECLSDKEGSSSTSDTFAMIGTLFLWMFWPSFNAAMAVGDAQHRAVLNTVMSLCGSCLMSFAMSSFWSREKKFNMVHIQNATLAGGVAIGAVADLMIQPFGALIIGSAAGILSTLGYVFLTPLLQKRLGLHDTCGVHNLHGMPGLFGGLLGVVMAAMGTEHDYGESLYSQYPARSPLNGTQEFLQLQQNVVTLSPGAGRSAMDQALYQLAALGVTIGIAIFGGVLTGTILRIRFFNTLPQHALFDDAHHWHLVEDEIVTPEVLVDDPATEVCAEREQTI